MTFRRNSLGPKEGSRSMPIIWRCVGSQAKRMMGIGRSPASYVFSVRILRKPSKRKTHGSANSVSEPHPNYISKY